MDLLEGATFPLNFQSLEKKPLLSPGNTNYVNFWQFRLNFNERHSKFKSELSRANNSNRENGHVAVLKNALKSYEKILTGRHQCVLVLGREKTQFWTTIASYFQKDFPFFRGKNKNLDDMQHIHYVSSACFTLRAPCNLFTTFVLRSRPWRMIIWGCSYLRDFISRGKIGNSEVDKISDTRNIFPRAHTCSSRIQRTIQNLAFRDLRDTKTTNVGSDYLCLFLSMRNSCPKSGHRPISYFRACPVFFPIETRCVFFLRSSNAESRF